MSISMRCPKCGSCNGHVVSTAHTDEGKIVRRRHCYACDERWYTVQLPEKLLDKEAFHWIDRNGHRRTIRLEPRPK